jgi:hypothetical protein
LFYLLSEWLLFNANSGILQLYISWREQCSMRWWWDPLCTRQTTLNLIFIVLAHWNNSPRIEISPHSDTLSWFRANQSLIFLLNATCLSEKQQIPMSKSLIWPDRGSNPRSTTLEASTLTITPPMWLVPFEIRILF